MSVIHSEFRWQSCKDIMAATLELTTHEGVIPLLTTLTSKEQMTIQLQGNVNVGAVANPVMETQGHGSNFDNGEQCGTALMGYCRIWSRVHSGSLLLNDISALLFQLLQSVGRRSARHVGRRTSRASHHNWRLSEGIQWFHCLLCSSFWLGGSALIHGDDLQAAQHYGHGAFRAHPFLKQTVIQVPMCGRKPTLEWTGHESHVL